MTEPPIGIMLTMPVAFFGETGHTSETLEKQFADELNKEDGIWYFLKKTLPTQDFLYVYLIWDGQIKFRVNLLELQRNRTYRFCDGPGVKFRTFENKNWILLCGPAIKPPVEIKKRGFQGFRYVWEDQGSGLKYWIKKGKKYFLPEGI